MELGYLGGSSEIKKKKKKKKKKQPWVHAWELARGQNLGHLCNVICICVKVFQMLISRQSLITKHSYLKLGYLRGFSDIPKEHTTGFMPGGKALKSRTSLLCYMR